MNNPFFRKTCLAMSAVMLISGIALGQGTSFGIRAGVNFQNLNGKDATGDKLENSQVPRFHAGVQADIPIAPEFYFQPGLLFSTKGAKSETVILEQTVETNINIAYVELPLHFVFKPVLGGGHFILGVGPYLAYGVGGKVKFESGANDDTQDLKFENKVTVAEAIQDPYVRPFDAGADLFFGYEFANGIFFQVNTQLGLLDIHTEIEDLPDDDSKLQNTGFGLSAGYNF